MSPQARGPAGIEVSYESIPLETSMNSFVALCYAHALGEGGYPKDVRWLASALKQCGVNVALCVSTKGEQTREGLADDVPVWDLSDLAGRSDSLVCAHFFGIFIPDHIPVLKQLKRRRIPIILSPWAQLLENALVKSRLQKQIYLRWHRRVFESVDMWSVFSETEWNSVVSIFGNNCGSRVFGGLGHYPIQSTDLEAASRRDDDGGPFQILFFGRCDVWQKGIDILLEAFIILCRTCAIHGIQLPHLTIAGRPWRDSERTIRCYSERIGSDLISRIVDVADEEIPALYGRADLFAYISRFDGPPRPLRMAVEFGVPVLASLEAGMVEAISILGAGSTTTLNPTDVAAHLFNSVCTGRNSRSGAKQKIGPFNPTIPDWSWEHVANLLAIVYGAVNKHEMVSSSGVPHLENI